MALTPLVTEDLVKRLKVGDRIASMGYPDIVAQEADVERWLGGRKCEMRADSETICKWHGLKPQKIPEADSFFAAFGAHLFVFDIVAARGGEIICDLNYPMPQPLYRDDLYKFVLDVGTIEHCFNIGQAALNMAGLLQPGGIIYHSNPFVMGNHGFYGLNPTWFADFYGQPGFELLWCKLMAKGGNEPIDIPLTKRFILNGGEVNIFAAARRNEVKSIGFPMQTKYASLAAAGQPGEMETT